jgi:hypothetical protein
MSSIEKVIEDKLAMWLELFIGDLAKVRTSWDVAQAGGVKDVEDDVMPFIDVKISVGSYTLYSAPIGEWMADMCLYVPVCLDPNGKKVEEIWARLSNWLSCAQLSLDLSKEHLDQKDVFALHGFRSAGGGALQITDGAYAIPFSVQIRGRYFPQKL